MGTFRKSFALLAAAIVVVGCKDDAATTGTLVINVGGLPTDAAAAVTVTGPATFSKTVTKTTQLEQLDPGTYTVRVSTVHFGNVLYASTTTQETKVIAAGGTESSNIGYTLAGGIIDLTITGLPTATQPIISLTGPPTFTPRTLTAGGIIGELPPGTYTVRADTTANPVGDRFGASALTQTVNVTASTTPVPASVAYAQVTGALDLTVTGLPSNTSAAPINVTGPGGFSRFAAASSTLRGMLPGTYTITANDVSGTCPFTYQAGTHSQTVDVAVAATSTASVGYSQQQVNSASLNLKIANVHLVQVVQDSAGGLPLVANRSALVRVFGIANQCNTATPKVKITLSTDAANPIVVNAPQTTVPLVSDQGTLLSTWNATIPGNKIQPGMTILAEIDPDVAIAETDESDNKFPASGTPKPLDVRTVPTVGLRFVQIVNPAQPSGQTDGNITPGNAEQFLTFARKIHPISAYDIDFRANPYTTTRGAFQSQDQNGAWTGTLSDLRALKTTDSINTAATNRWYHGILRVTYNSGVAGIGYIGGKAALSWDFLPSASGVLAHELGHNYGSFHSPCSPPGTQITGVDGGYPYSGASIGKWGYDATDNTLKSPSFYTDIMGYCNTQWISDYSFFKMMQYIISTGASTMITSASVQPGLLVWGRIISGEPVLEPVIEVNAMPELPNGSGPNRLIAADGAGGELFNYAFNAERIADAPGDVQSFSFMIPRSALRGRSLASLKLSVGGKTAVNLASATASQTPNAVVTRTSARTVNVQWDAVKFPVVMVRDAASGQVLSFARGGNATIVATQDNLELSYSNRVGSTRQSVRLK